MLNLIPKPQKAVEKTGAFVINKEVKVSFAPEFAEMKPFLLEAVQKAGITLEEGEGAKICFVLDQKLPREGYALSVSNAKINAKASTPAGALYAIETLRQLGDMDLHKNAAELRIPAVEIEDAPRFEWRGQMLDSGRHFWSVSEIKRLLDLMAAHKLNVFHWHLTDDQGWRIEIKRYPLLTEIGSKRKDTQLSGWKTKNVRKDGKPHEGFYTQEEIKDVVAYAQKRCIMVVPEVDMPAHFAAAEAAYNWLGCREIPCEVLWYFGGIVPRKLLGYKDNSWNRSACLGKDTTYEFIYHVLDEVCDLFPAPYFHIGGDEAPRDEWKNCPHCQAKMKEQGLKSVDELQGYFNNQINEYVKKKGKRLIGWNEILNAGTLDKSVIGQYWEPQRDRHAERYINEGGQMIMSRHKAFYFDMMYANYPLSNTYKFEPVHQGILPEAEKNVLGVEGELWTEFITDREKLDMNLFPRMEALSEVAWTAKGTRDFKDFMRRLEHFKRVLDAWGVNYAEDKIAMPNLFTRPKYMLAFNNQDPYLEVKRNRELKNSK